MERRILRHGCGRLHIMRKVVVKRCEPEPRSHGSYLSDDGVENTLESNPLGYWLNEAERTAPSLLLLESVNLHNLKWACVWLDLHHAALRDNARGFHFALEWSHSVC